MKIHLLGASGSGVSTLGKALASRLQLDYFDSDAYFWAPSEPPFSQRREPSERNRLVMQDLQSSQGWVLGGSILNWGGAIFPPFDLIVFLYLPLELRMKRLEAREFARYGSVIYEDPERNRLFREFLAWARDYDENTGIANRTLQAHRAWLAEARAPVLEISGDLTVEERVLRVVEQLQEFG
ncbi:MAG: adenylate kinase [Bacteroidetes bacterium]|nr:adenylate kinase [Bacteroidota bacterium]